MSVKLTPGKHFGNDDLGYTRIFAARGRRDSARTFGRTWMVNSPSMPYSANQFSADRCVGFVLDRFTVSGDVWQCYYAELDAWEALALFLEGIIMPKDLEAAKEKDDSIVIKDIHVAGKERQLTIVPMRSNIYTLMCSGIGAT